MTDKRRELRPEHDPVPAAAAEWEEEARTSAPEDATEDRPPAGAGPPGVPEGDAEASAVVADRDGPERRPEDDPVHAEAADWEEAGLPAQEDATEDHPLPGAGPTAMSEDGAGGTEREAGEPHEVALSRERPDAGAGEDPQGLVEPEHTGEPGTADPTARLVEPDEGVRPDTEKDVVAEERSEDRGALSAEEDAVRIRRER
jgi:hypothetical protein